MCASGAPVATIAPLLPGQPTNIIVSSSMGTPTVQANSVAQKGNSGFPGVMCSSASNNNSTPCGGSNNNIAAVVPSMHHHHQQATTTNNSGNVGPLSVAVQGNITGLDLMGATPPVGIRHHQQHSTVTSQSTVTSSTDILAKAAESIFSTSDGGAMSPGFYNPVNDDNPLQIDDTLGVSTPTTGSVSNATQNDMQHHIMDLQQFGGQHHPVSLPNDRNVTLTKSASSKNSGAKNKSTKPKEPKSAKSKKKSGAKDKTKNQANAKNNSSEVENAHHQFMHMNNQGFVPSLDPTGLHGAFPVTAEHYVADLADSLDDGDNGSDINDFSDLITINEPRPTKSMTLPGIAQTTASISNVPNNFTSVASSPDSLPSLPPIITCDLDATTTNNTPTTATMSLGVDNTIATEAMIVSSPLNTISQQQQSSSFTESESASTLITTTTTTCISTETVLSASYSDSVPQVTVSVGVCSVPNIVTDSEYASNSSLPSVMSSVVTSPPPCTASMQTTSLDNATTTVSDIQSTSQSEISEVSPTINSTANNLMGLTPMEIIQSIAESTGMDHHKKEKGNRNSTSNTATTNKEKKEPSPRISQKKLAKAGKGPPAGNIYYQEVSESPKKAEQAKSPRNRAEQQAKSPKRTDKSPKRTHDLKSEQTVKETPVRDHHPVEEQTSKPSSVNNELPGNNTQRDLTLENSGAIKELGKGSQKKESKKKDIKKSPKKDTSKQQTVEQLLEPSPDKSAESKSPTKASPSKSQKAADKGKKTSRSKERSSKGREQQQVQEKPKQGSTVEEYPDEPPTLEKEEPFPVDSDQNSKHGKNAPGKSGVRRDTDENIFMNAIISEKSDYFRTGHSIFSQGAMGHIPPFTNASLPPTPFGFANPFFRFPMMGASSGLPGYQPHLPLFAQNPPLFSSNSFGEVPYKFPNQPMCVSPRGSGASGSFSGGNSDVNRKSPWGNVTDGTGKDKDSKKKGVTSGKHKKSKKDKKRSSENSAKNGVEKTNEAPPVSVSGDNVSKPPSSSSQEISVGNIEMDLSLKSLQSNAVTNRPNVMPADNEPISSPALDNIDYQGEVAQEVDKTSKRKKGKKKKKDKKKQRDKSESEYEIVEHSVIQGPTDEEMSKNLDDVNNETTVPEQHNVEANVVEDEAIANVTGKGRKSRSRTRKKSSKNDNLIKSPDVPDQETFTTESPIRNEVQMENDAYNLSKDNRKTYSLRGRGLSPKGGMEEPPADLFDEDLPVQNKYQEESSTFDNSPMTKISPLKESPLKDQPESASKGKSKGRGRGRSKKNKDEASNDRSVVTKLTFSENPEASVQEKGLKIKISNNKSSQHTPSVEKYTDVPLPQTVTNEPPSSETSSLSGKILKTSRAQRKSDYSPPKLPTLGADIVAGSPKKSRRSSPVKQTAKTMAKKSSSTPTSVKSGPFDVFDFDDEPEEMLPTSLKSFTSKSKEQAQFKQQPESPTKAPVLKLTIGKQSKVVVQSPNVDYTSTTNTELTDSGLDEGTACKTKRGKKVGKSKKKSKKNIPDDIAIETMTPVEPTDSGLSTTLDSPLLEVPAKKPKGRPRKQKKQTPENNGEEPRNVTSELTVPIEPVSEENDSQEQLSTSVNESDNSEKESSSMHKEHVGLEKTIKALSQRLHSTSPIRMPPVMPEFDEMPTVPPKEKKSRSKSRKRGRESSQSESESLLNTTTDSDIASVKYGPVPDANSDFNNRDSQLNQSTPSMQVDNANIDSSKSLAASFDKAEKEHSKELMKTQPSLDVESNSGAASLDEPATSVPSISHRKGKSKKRSKEEAKLDEPKSTEPIVETPSDPTPAKVSKLDSIIEGLSSQSKRSQPDQKKSAKKRRLSPSKTDRKKADSGEGGNSGISLHEGNMPESITFSENDLFAVLDQVEGQSSSNTTQDHQSGNGTFTPPEDEFVPSKKSKLTDTGDSESQKSRSDSVFDSNRSTLNEKKMGELSSTDTVESQKESEPTNESHSLTTDSKQLNSEVPQNPIEWSNPSVAGGESPSKKERKRDRKKRRKEKHAVRMMSEGDFPQPGFNVDDGFVNSSSSNVKVTGNSADTTNATKDAVTTTSNVIHDR